jgi:hypothetical protein
MSFWQDITTCLIVGAAAVYCCAQLLMLGRKWSGGGGCSKGCNTCPVNRANGVSGEGVQQVSLVQISKPGKP